MTEREISTTAELWLGGGPIPLKFGIARTMTRRFSERGMEALVPSLQAAGEASLGELLAGNEELDVLVVKAVGVAAESASAAKRRLLGEVVKAAVLDNAKIDESILMLGVLQQIDTAHIRCLEAIHRAEQEAKAAGDMKPTARGAEKELTRQVGDVADAYPSPLLQQLERLGLIDGSITWDGTTHITGTTTFGEQILDDLRSVKHPTASESG